MTQYAKLSSTPDLITIEAQARALRAAYARRMVAGLFARLRQTASRVVHA